MNRSLVLILTCIFSSVLAGGALAGPAENIAFMTEQYPPYNFEQNGKASGIAVDLLDAVFKQMGAAKTVADIRVLPWANGYKKVQNDQNTCLFSMTRTDAREALFKWVGPIASTRVVLMARKDKNIKIESTDDIKKYKIGVINADIGEQLLLEAGIPKGKLQGTAKTLTNIKKLEKGRIDLLSYGEHVTKWEMKNSGFNPEKFETVHALTEGDLYFAFHKSTPDSILQEFQTALDTVKSNGTYGKIMDKYLR